MKKAMKLVSLVLAVVMLLGCLAACSSKSATTDSTASTDTASTDTAASDSSEASSDGGEIVIALISNTTGDYAQYGQPVRDGAMLYINQLNANGGINGKQVKVLEYDDKGDGVEAVNAYNLACDNGITAVFGATLTGPTIALADATYEDNMPQVTASATASGVTMIDPDDPDSEIRQNVFRACFIDPYQGKKMADYAVEKLSAKTAAIFYQTGSDYSEGLMNAFAEEAKAIGLEIVDTEAFAEGDKDFKAQMTNIAAAAPDVVFAPIYYAEAGLAITAARAAGCPGLFRRLRRLRCLLRRLCGLCGQGGLGLFPGLALGGVLRPEAVRAVRVDAVAGRDRLRHDGREKERRNLDIRAARPIILPGRRARYGAELRQGLLVLLVQLRLDFGFCIAHGTLRSRDGPRRHGTCGGLGAFRPARRPRGQARGGAQADCQDCA